MGTFLQTDDAGLQDTNAMGGFRQGCLVQSEPFGIPANQILADWNLALLLYVGNEAAK